MRSVQANVASVMCSYSESPLLPPITVALANAVTCPEIRVSPKHEHSPRPMRRVRLNMVKSQWVVLVRERQNFERHPEGRVWFPRMCVFLTLQ